jgi:hypothetical protein
MSLDVYLADLGRLRQGRAESDQPVKVTVFRRYWNVPIFGGADRIRKLSDQYCAIYSDSAPEGAAALLVVPIDSLDDFGKPVVGELAHAYGVVAPGRAIALHVDDAVGAFLTA